MWWVALGSVGLAHVGAILEVLEFASPGPSIEANFGLLLRDGTGWSWVCHEAVTSPGAIIAPRYSENVDGAWLVSVPALEQVREPGRSVYRSDDGCDWSPVAGLDDATVTRVLFDPVDPSVALAVTADLGDERTNGVYRSTDGGRSFVPVWSEPRRLFRSLLHDPARPGVAWATAVWYPTGEAWLLATVDGGLTWSSTPIPLGDEASDLVQADVIGAHDGEVWLSVGRADADHLIHSDGSAFTELLVADVDLLDAAVDPEGTLWVTGTNRRLYRAEAGASLAQVADPPGGYALVVEDGALWASGFAQFTGRAALRYDPTQQAFVDVLHLSELQPPPDCPADSDVARTCEPLWPDLAGRLPQPFVDSADTGALDTTSPPTTPPPIPSEAEAESGCGCQGSPAVGLLVPFGLLRRRGRR